MDVSAFKEVGEEDLPSLSEVAALIDEDLRLPVAGAVAIVRHLLRLALLVLTLAACVLLYCFTLAWLCLFWAQTRLFKYTSVFLDSCMSTTPITTGDKLNTSIPVSSTVKANASATLEGLDLTQAAAAISGSRLAAEAHNIPHPREDRPPARITLATDDLSGQVDIDEEAISRDILQREEELEAEIQELALSHGSDWGCEQPETLGEVDSTKSKEASITVDTSLPVLPQRPEDVDQPNSKHEAKSEPPRASTFKITKAKVNDKPRINYAEQLKERKARDQTTFVNTLTANSILSPKKDVVKGRSTAVEHLKSTWSGDSVVSPARGRPLTAITKTRSPAPSLAAAPIPKGPKHQPKHEAAKPAPAGGKPSSSLPPHLRIALDAKTRRAAAGQLAYEETVKARETVPTDNPYAALSDETASADDRVLPQVSNGGIDDPYLGKSDTDVIASQEPPSTPKLVKPLTQQSRTVFVEASDTPLQEYPDKVADATADTRRVYTLDALKATKNASLDIHEDALIDKIEAAAELVSFHTHSGRASRSPKKKSAGGRWSNFDGKKEHPPASAGSPKYLPVTEVDKAILQPGGSSALLQDRQDSAIAISPKAGSAEDKVNVLAGPAIAIKDTGRTTRSTSSNLELMGLEFGIPTPRDEPIVENTTPDASRSLPITPGPLSFFAPKVTAKENVPTENFLSSGWRPYPEPIAFNAFAPGPFQSNAYHHSLPPQHFQPQQFEWSDSGVHANQDRFHVPPQVASPMPSFNPMASEYAHSNTRTMNQRRPSLAIPIKEPTFDPTSDEMFPALGATKLTLNTRQPPGPPGLGAASPDTQATFDALIPKVETTPGRVSNLGKFISTATKSSASLDKTHGEAVVENGSAVTAIRVQNLPLIGQKEPLSSTKLPTAAYDATFPELPKVVVSDIKAGDIPSDKNMKREQKKVAREGLRDAWYDREVSRKKLNASFSLEGANDLKQKTLLYLGKRSALQSLMVSGTLNPQDTEMFPEFGAMDLSPPKVNALTADEWRSRKRESTAVVVEPTDAAPVVAAEPSDDIASIIKDMVTAQGHREAARARLKEPRPQSNMAYATWLKTCNQTCARADKLYCRKRKILVAAFPAGLSSELELRFPDILT